MKTDWTKVLIYLTFAIFLVLFFWFVFGESPTFEQLLAGILGLYGSFLLHLNKEIFELRKQGSLSEQRLHDKLTELERRLEDRINLIK
jgi:drug/metabolite transporter (DMT)-like permease